MTKRVCALKGCYNVFYSSSFCLKHYGKLRTYGDPLFSHDRRHGMTKTPEHISWFNMKARCNRPNHPSYKDYGGRGIKVCSSWQKSFMNFYRDMGERPSGTSIDRIDVNGNYEPGNCRWATKSQQQMNTRGYSSSGAKNVYKATNAVGYTIAVNGKYGGYFKTVDEAKTALITFKEKLD